MQPDHELATANKTEDGPDTPEESPVLVELVDDRGTRIGVREKVAAHQHPGHLHRAFSVFLFDQHNRLLLQRRALTKYHSPGVWSNSCCGHPYPGESPFVAAARRTVAELGVSPAELREAGTVRYSHPDAITGLVESEYNHLFVGLVRQSLRPDPDEVSDTAFVTPDELRALQGSHPFSAWFDTVLQAAQPAIGLLTGRTA
jgi:isopentenyl-diphosphate delta-isomerase